jgi:hypothetical protein
LRSFDSLDLNAFRMVDQRSSNILN